MAAILTHAANLFHPSLTLAIEDSDFSLK